MKRTTVGIVALLAAAACSGEGTGEDGSFSGVASSLTGAGGIEATMTVTQSWQGGYCANVAVANKGTSATTTWKTAINLAGGSVSSFWNATQAVAAGTLTATPLSWNGQLSPGASATFGLCVNVANNTRGQISSVSAQYVGGTSGGSGGTSGGASGGTSSGRTDGGVSGGTSGGVSGGTSGGVSGGTSGGVSGGTSGGTSGTTPTGTPVSRYGQLKVSGTRLVDKNNNPVQLKGVSSMWLNWEDDGYAQNATALKWMRDNWKLSVIRAAMGVEPSGAYLSDPNRAKNQVNQIVQNAIDAGVYVIIDWHDHNAQNHTAQAQAFFSEMAAKWGGYPNVIYETFNEPLQVSWSGVLKPYHQAVLSSIRAKDPDNIVVLGTGQWSQLVDEAAGSPVAGTNIMYTLHFYACTHGQWLRDKANTALSRGLPIFVTEWGATHADGGMDGIVCQSEAQAWTDWMKTRGIGWAAWKLDDCTPDSSCILRGGAPVTGGWTSQWLFGHGAFVRDRMME